MIRQYYLGTTKMNALRTDEMNERFPGLLPVLVDAAAQEAPVPAA